MKIIIPLLVLCNVLTCKNSTKMEADFKHTLERKKKLSVYEVGYSENKPVDTSFYKGYWVKQKKVITRRSIETLIGLVSDSANYSPDRSKNCVLAANYGVKVTDDSLNYIVFIGKQPCMKILILDERLKSETVFDLTDHNTIIPFFDSLFIRVPRFSI